MSDLPIIMSGPMVRATLREVEAPGTGKTMTRRMGWRQCYRDDKGAVERKAVGEPYYYYERPTIWQKVKPGDMLYVKEAFSVLVPRHVRLPGGGVEWREAEPMFALDYEGFDKPERDWNWTSARFMPRRFSRLTLIVTETRLEPLQAITEEDAVAEGIKQRWTCLNPATGSYAHDNNVVDDFRALWDSLHGPGAWAANPDVVPIRFVPHLANIDSKAA